jgi:signal transduction histidine kinase
MRWFCGGFIWSNKAIRLLHKDSELSFLRAFGMSIMSEVAKLDTAMADRAKSDLLNSISHELRSPLHGILGSIECLESTDLDPMQHGLVETVDTCGRTLLDTINHLLDFSKINNFTRNKSKRQKNSESRQADMLSLDSTVHLPTITEEALETVFAGYSSSASLRETTNSSQASKSSTLNRNVEVVVDIEAKDHENWLLCTEGGAWKRLVMNLVSNLACSCAGNILTTSADWQQFEVHKRRLHLYQTRFPGATERQLRREEKPYNTDHQRHR